MAASAGGKEEIMYSATLPVARLGECECGREGCLVVGYWFITHPALPYLKGGKLEMVILRGRD